MDHEKDIGTTWIDIDVEDGTGMPAYLAEPVTEGTYPAIIVWMEIFGVNNYIRSVTERLAREGYIVIAPNFFHRTDPMLQLGYTPEDIQEGRRHKDQTTREGILADARATIEFLKQNPRVAPKTAMGSVGFCFGGHVAYLVATLPEIVATASFYGAGIAKTTPGGGEPTVTVTPQIHGEMLCLFGTEDPSIPSSDIHLIEQALTDAHVTHNVLQFEGAGHGFFCDQRDDYHPGAAQAAWKTVTHLFEKHFTKEYAPNRK